MKIATLLTIAIITITAETKMVKKLQWELLGTSTPIDLLKAAKGDCLIYGWDTDKWKMYSSDTKDISSIKANKGFFATSTGADCMIEFSYKADSMDTKDMTKSRFYSMKEDEETRLIDKNTELEWINSSPGCLPLNPGLEMQNAKNTVQDHCNNVSFSGKSDWRVPQASEVKEFLMGTSQEGIIPYYKNKGCPRLIGLSPDGTLSTINTHNNEPIGMIKPWEKLNAGIRCVRANSGS